MLLVGRAKSSFSGSEIRSSDVPASTGSLPWWVDDEDEDEVRPDSELFFDEDDACQAALQSVIPGAPRLLGREKLIDLLLLQSIGAEAMSAFELGCERFIPRVAQLNKLWAKSEKLSDNDGNDAELDLFVALAEDEGPVGRMAVHSFFEYLVRLQTVILGVDHLAVSLLDLRQRDYRRQVLAKIILFGLGGEYRDATLRALAHASRDKQITWQV